MNEGETMQYRSSTEKCCESAKLNTLDGRWYCRVAEAEMAERRRCAQLVAIFSRDRDITTDLFYQAIRDNWMPFQLERGR